VLKYRLRGFMVCHLFQIWTKTPATSAHPNERHQTFDDLDDIPGAVCTENG
jgi:hypothetical protein